MPATDPHTPEQVRNWRKHIREWIGACEETGGDPDVGEEYRSFSRGRAAGLGTALEVLDDLFGPED